MNTTTPTAITDSGLVAADRTVDQHQRPGATLYAAPGTTMNRRRFGDPLGNILADGGVDQHQFTVVHDATTSIGHVIGYQAALECQCAIVAYAPTVPVRDTRLAVSDGYVFNHGADAFLDEKDTFGRFIQRLVSLDDDFPGGQPADRDVFGHDDARLGMHRIANLNHRPALSTWIIKCRLNCLEVAT